ncbi:MAG: hypothetical protein HQ546_06425 [Planctomycetes bacterium]|nr:hypothetical protein [Planctomycetota bacterium]
MKKLSRPDKRAIVYGAVVLAVIVAARLAFVPWLNGWGDARTRIATAQSQIDELAGKARRASGQRSRLAEAYGPAAGKELTDLRDAQRGLLKVAQDIFKANGFEVASGYDPQRPRQVKGLAGVQLVPMQVRGTCKLPQLVKCLTEMRKAPTLVFVDRLTIENDAKKPGQLTVTMTLATLGELRRARS